MDALQKLSREIDDLKKDLNQRNRAVDKMQKELANANKYIQQKLHTLKDKEDEFADIVIRSSYEGLRWTVSSIQSPCVLNFDQTKSHYMDITEPKPILAWRPQMANEFVTSDVNGRVTVREFNPQGPARVLFEVDALASPNNPPLDVVWDSIGARMVCVYRVGRSTSQVSVINLREGTPDEDRISFLGRIPHSYGILTGATFLSWREDAFVTYGSDHTVNLWYYRDNQWMEYSVHDRGHCQAILGAACLKQVPTIVSVGEDKRIFGFDTVKRKEMFIYDIDKECIGVLANPNDDNLLSVSTWSENNQLRLFDIRSKSQHIHAFGWDLGHTTYLEFTKIKQYWCQGGMQLLSGDQRGNIHIFDIRYCSGKPSHSLQVHNNAVYKAVSHHGGDRLLSVSTDCRLGVHTIN